MTLFQCKLCAVVLTAHRTETPEQAEVRLTRDERPVPPCKHAAQVDDLDHVRVVQREHSWRGVVDIAFFADREYRGEYR